MAKNIVNTYPRFIVIYTVNNPYETPSWMLGGINRKHYYEAMDRTIRGIPCNPETEPGRMGKEAGLPHLGEYEFKEGTVYHAVNEKLKFYGKGTDKDVEEESPKVKEKKNCDSCDDC